MILDSYMWSCPSFFTKEEVEEIHQHAFMVPIEEGTIGNNSDDPDADVSRPPEDYEVRSSRGCCMGEVLLGQAGGERFQER